MKSLSRSRKGTAYCYILQCADGSYYTGWTNDLRRRFREHESGRGGRYTRSRRPVALVYFERQTDSGAARRREAEIKKLPRTKKMELAGAKRKGKRLKKTAAETEPQSGRCACDRTGTRFQDGG
jgi:putative endonuclease